MLNIPNATDEEQGCPNTRSPCFILIARCFRNCTFVCDICAHYHRVSGYRGMYFRNDIECSKIVLMESQ